MLAIKCQNGKDNETVPEIRKRLNCTQHCAWCACLKVKSEATV